MILVRSIVLAAAVGLLALCPSEDENLSRPLEVRALTEHTYVHVSYLSTESWGEVPCNGMLFVRDGEAIVFDTPATPEASLELIRFVRDSLRARIVAVVINHFHDDCLGGLSVFHKRGIPSFASDKTLELEKKNGLSELPRRGFRKKLRLEAGGEPVINRYFGAGHTQDNIVSYIPSEKVLFGGCLIKASGASKGNLADADTLAWPVTVKRIQKAYPEVRTVIPGHGAVGGTELLGYTVALFE